MLSKNKIKYIRSLELKKKRKEEQVFVAEGHKLVGDLLGYFPCKLLIATSNWLKINHPVTANEIIEVTQEELSRASLQKTPQEVLSVFVQPSYDLNPEVIKSSLCLALDDVQDPGNLGTIIRAGEGAGITGVVMSSDTADIYNPKVIRSTMGAVFRMPFLYVEDLPEKIKELQKEGIKTYAAHLRGENAYDEEDYTTGCAFLIGNEGNGLRDEVADCADCLIRIPMEGEAESLNASVAAALLMFEAGRQRRNNKNA